MDKFWMVYVEDSKGCTYKHFNRTEAMEEAERLIRQPANSGKKVYILESVGYAHFEPMPIKWETLKPITGYSDAS